MAGKIFKISLIICVTALFSFAQTADTTKQQKPIQTADNKIQNGSAKAATNLPTDVKPKQPTNWSKIKDLFL